MGNDIGTSRRAETWLDRANYPRTSFQTLAHLLFTTSAESRGRRKFNGTDAGDGNSLDLRRHATRNNERTEMLTVRLCRRWEAI